MLILLASELGIRISRVLLVATKQLSEAPFLTVKKMSQLLGSENLGYRQVQCCSLYWKCFITPPPALLSMLKRLGWKNVEWRWTVCEALFFTLQSIFKTFNKGKHGILISLGLFLWHKSSSVSFHSSRYNSRDEENNQGWGGTLDIFDHLAILLSLNFFHPSLSSFV